MTHRSVHDLRRPRPGECNKCGNTNLSYRKTFTLGLTIVCDGFVAVCMKERGGCGNRMVYQKDDVTEEYDND